MASSADIDAGGAAATAAESAGIAAAASRVRLLGLGVGLVGTDRRRIGHGLPCPFHRLDIHQHVVEGGLHGVNAYLRQVREVAFRRRPRDVEVARLGTNGLERLTRGTDLQILGVRVRAARRGGLVGAHQLLAEGGQRLDVGIEGAAALLDGDEQRLAALAGGRQLGPARVHSLLEFAGAVLESRHFGRECRGALHQPRVRGSGFGQPRGQTRHRVTRLGSRRCASYSRASASRCVSTRRRLAASAPCRRASAAVALLFGASALEADLIRLPREPRHLVHRAGHLRVEADERLFVLVLLALQRRQRAGRGGDRRLELRHASAARSSTWRSAAVRSVSSLISRRVARMPRASTRAPPDTRCAPRSTSPSSVATGASLTRAKDTACSNVSAM
jgi:hypothetical protein